MNLDQMFAKVIASALHNIQEHGSLTPVILLFRGKEFVTGIVLDMQNEIAKSASIAAARAKGREMDADCAVMIVEAWVAGYSEGQDPDIMPSKREDRREIVVVQAHLRDKDPMVRLYDIVRDWKGKVRDLTRDESPPSDQITGRLIGLL
jgi:hypothetical protein